MALTVAPTVAPSERELRRVAIPLCFHGSLVSLKAETVAACVRFFFFFARTVFSFH